MRNALTFVPDSIVVCVYVCVNSSVHFGARTQTDYESLLPSPIHNPPPEKETHAAAAMAQLSLIECVFFLVFCNTLHFYAKLINENFKYSYYE